MKKLLTAIVMVLAVSVFAQMQTGRPTSITTDRNYPAIEVRGSTNQAAPYFVIKNESGTLFAIPATGVLPAAYGGTGTNVAVATGVVGYTLKTNTIIYVSGITLEKNAANVTNVVQTLATNTVIYLGK